MKLKFNILFAAYVITGLLLVSCMEDEGVSLSQFSSPHVSIDVAENGNDIKLNARISGNCDLVSECGFYYSQNKDLSGAEKIVIENESSSTFSCLLELRDYEKVFYCAAFISNGTDEIFSEYKSFEIKPLSSFVKFGSVSVKSYDATSANIQAKLTLENKVKLSRAGFCYGVEDNPSISGKYIECKPETTFNGTISGLDVNTTYKVRAFVQSGDHIAYSETRSLKIAAKPTVKTVKVQNIEPHKAVLSCTIKDDGGTDLREMGAVWSISDSNPIINETYCKSSKLDTTFIGDYTILLSGLNRETSYYARAYAINDEGISYGEVLTFITGAYTTPVLDGGYIDDVGYNFADVAWYITSTGGPDTYETGLLWANKESLDINDTTINKIKKSASGTNSFEYTIENLKASTIYYVRPYAVNEEGVAYGETVSFTTLDLPEPNDLSSSGVANSYVVSMPGTYKLRTVIGNSEEDIIDIATSEVMWESSVYRDTTKRGDLIDAQNIFYKDGYLIFATNKEFRKGNALLSVKNSSGDVLWSWHIWLTDYPSEQVYKNDSGIMMDRNLGAISATPPDVGTLGLLYQWGRKDPFLSGSDISENKEPISSYIWPSSEKSDANIGTYEYSVRNPMIFISVENEEDDWIYDENSANNEERWGITKSIYDPCPYGWRVPDGGIVGVWLESGFDEYNADFDFDYRGIIFDKVSDDYLVWYPASGHKGGLDGELNEIGVCGYYWSSSMLNGGAITLNFTTDSEVNSTSYFGRANGNTVRCIKDIEYDRYLLPRVELDEVSKVTDTSAFVVGDIVYAGMSDIISKGFVWGTMSSPSLDNGNVIEVADDNEHFQVNINSLEPETKYYIRAFAENSSGVKYSTEVSFTTETNYLNSKNLSRIGTANCYIVSEKGSYRFEMVKGNSSDIVGEVASAEVLWESYGTSSIPEEGSLIKEEISIRNNYLIFSTADTFHEGNAVIAAKDKYGKILWSWHIWLTDMPSLQSYKNEAGDMMDRNLGATSVTPGEVGTLGLLYQWGRKDPFLGSSSIDDDVIAKSTIVWPNAVKTNSAVGTIEYTIANPTTFIYGESDWCYVSDSGRWTKSFEEKSIYDPCPVGWRVPDGGSNGVWSNADFTYTTFITSNGKGMYFNIANSLTTWYPAAGGRTDFNSSALKSVGSTGFYWSSSSLSYGTKSYYLLFTSQGNFNTYYNHYNSLGLSVRCVLASDDFELDNGDGGNEGIGEEDEYEW